MATKPYFLWGDTHAASASDSDAAAVYASRAPETAALLAAATAAGDTAAVAPELGAVSVARPRMMRRNPSAFGKQQQQPQQAGGGGAKKRYGEYPSGGESLSSSSTESGSPDCRVALPAPSLIGSAAAGSVGQRLEQDGLQQPPWLHKCLNLAR